MDDTEVGLSKPDYVCMTYDHVQPACLFYRYQTSVWSTMACFHHLNEDCWLFNADNLGWSH